MKKIVFAVQVFGIIAMFPIVVILEMNHAASGPFENNSSSRVIQKTEIASTSLPEKTNDKGVNETFPITLGMFVLNNAY